MIRCDDPSARKKVTTGQASGRIIMRMMADAPVQVAANISQPKGKVAVSNDAKVKTYLYCGGCANGCWNDARSCAVGFASAIPPGALVAMLA